MSLRSADKNVTILSFAAPAIKNYIRIWEDYHRGRYRTYHYIQLESHASFPPHRRLRTRRERQENMFLSNVTVKTRVSSNLLQRREDSEILCSFSEFLEWKLFLYFNYKPNNNKKISFEIFIVMQYQNDYIHFFI